MKIFNQMKMKGIYSILSLVLFCACSSGDTNRDNAKIKDPAPRYTLAPIEQGGVATKIKLPAQLSAYQEVNIFPKVNGYVKEVYVDIGSEVHTGQLLMLLEAPESVQATSQSKERYAQAKANYSIDKENYARLLEASATQGAVSPMDLSSARAKMEADSALANAVKTNWQMQQTMQDYLRVLAPFNGVITERNVFTGTLVSAETKDKPMLVLKDIKRLRLQVDLPEANAATFKTDDTLSFFTSAFPGKRIIAKINRTSMNVNAQYRSERIEADIDNRNEILQPGMYADVELYSRGNANAFSVPRSSIVTSTEAKYVIVVRGEKNTRVNVITGNETKERIEIFGNVHSGEMVIVNANDEIQ
jgi:membrane fusion protein, multidrug efflux system